MADVPEQPDATSNPRDKHLESQLDDLIGELEAVDPQSVPADLRKNQDPDEASPEPESEPPLQPEAPAEDELSPQPVATSEPLTPAAEPAAEVQPQAEQKSEPPPDTPTEPTPEPTAAAAEDTSRETPEKKPMDLESIASMASNLLDQQIQNTIESASEVLESDDADAEPEPEPADTSASADDVTNTAEASADDSSADTASKPKTSDLNDLGGQLDALLTEMKVQPQVEADESGAEQAEPAEAISDEEPEPIPIEAASSGASDEAEEPVVVSIDQIDAMLAESAEKAIEQEPAPVPGTDEILAAQAEAEAREAEAQAEEATVEPGPMPVPSSAQVDDDTSPADAEPEPQPIQTFEATADDVAHELASDEPPEQSQAAPAQPVEAQALELSDTDEPLEPVIHESGLKKAEQQLLRLCARINKPLDRLSDESRNTVGYIGVLTTAIALFLTLYGLLF